MPHLLFTPREDIKDTFRLAEAARNLGWSVERSSSYQPSPDSYTQDIVLYGETLFTTLAARALSYSVLEPDFDLLVRIPAQYLRRNVRKVSLEDAKKIDKPFFAKPADGNKALESQVYNAGSELSTWRLSNTMPLLISTPVEWQVEYRFFVLERHIATYSVYARFGELALDANGHWSAPEVEEQEAIKFCETILHDGALELPPAVVLDVGVINKQGWALIEPNPVSSSGIYGCDPEKVLPVLKRACIPTSELTDNDRRWIVTRPI